MIVFSPLQGTCHSSALAIGLAIIDDAINAAMSVDATRAKAKERSPLKRTWKMDEAYVLPGMNAWAT
jgi:hypothetical protein